MPSDTIHSPARHHLHDIKRVFGWFRRPGPGPGAAWAYALRHGPPRPGEEVTHLRLMILRDTDQHASPAHNLVSVESCRRWLMTPNLAWDFQSVPDEGDYGPLFAYLYFDRVPEADFEVGGQRLVTFAHDWRRMPAEPWLDLMSRRELDVEFQPAAVPGGQPQPLALSQPEFDQAVRRALHDLHRADLLTADGSAPRCWRPARPARPPTRRSSSSTATPAPSGAHLNLLRLRDPRPRRG